jgi:hypothetical protein
MPALLARQAKGHSRKMQFLIFLTKDVRMLLAVGVFMNQY